MFDNNPAIKEAVAALREFTRTFRRGDVLTHTQITSVIGLQPYEGSWKQIIRRFKEVTEAEDGITVWADDNHHAYRFQTVEQQLKDVPKYHARCAKRRLARARRSVKRVPVQHMTQHDREIQAFQERVLSQQLRHLAALRRQQAILDKPVAAVVVPKTAWVPSCVIAPAQSTQSSQVAQ